MQQTNLFFKVRNFCYRRPLRCLASGGGQHSYATVPNSLNCLITAVVLTVLLITILAAACVTYNCTKSCTNYLMFGCFANCKLQVSLPRGFKPVDTRELTSATTCFPILALKYLVQWIKTRKLSVKRNVLSAQSCD